MGEDDNTVELDFRERIQERDKISPSPEERAGYILNLIKDSNNNVTNWDILCFCTEYLGSQVLIYDWLEDELIKRLTIRVQIAHYMRDIPPDTGIR